MAIMEELPCCYRILIWLLFNVILPLGFLLVLSICAPVAIFIVWPINLLRKKCLGRRQICSIETHRKKVETVQEQVRAWNSSRRGKKLMCSGRSTWKALTAHDVDKRQFAQINLDALNEIVHIDTD